MWGESAIVRSVRRQSIVFGAGGNINRRQHNNRRRRNRVCGLWSIRRVYKRVIRNLVLISAAYVSRRKRRERRKRSVWSPWDAKRFDQKDSRPIIDSRRGCIGQEARRSVWCGKQLGDSSVRQINSTMPATDRVAEFANHAVRKFIETMHTNWTQRPANVPLPLPGCADVTTDGRG